MSHAPAHNLIHATCVDVQGRGVLILGNSGIGKTGLALEMMMRGARLVSDDQVQLHSVQNALFARAPARLLGKIELRGFGIVDMADIVEQTQIHFAIALQTGQAERFPDPVPESILAGVAIPTYPASDSDRFLAAKAIIMLNSFSASSPAAALHLASPANSA